MKKRTPFGKLFVLVTQPCKLLRFYLENVSPHQFWSIMNNFLVSRLHVQIRLVGNCGLHGVIPWLSNTDGAHCFFCKESIEDVSHVFDCSEFKDNFESVWANLNRKISSFNFVDRAQIANFINSLDRRQKALLLLVGFASPLIKQLPLSLPDFYPLLFLKFTA